MALIGFIALLALGVYFATAGLAALYGMTALTGKPGVYWLILEAIGVGFLYAAFNNAPFHFVLNY